MFTLTVSDPPLSPPPVAVKQISETLAQGGQGGYGDFQLLDVNLCNLKKKKSKDFPISLKSPPSELLSSMNK